MTQTIPEGIRTSAPGLRAAEAFPRDFEGFNGDEQLPLSALVQELVDKDDRSIVDTLMDHVDQGRLTKDAADSVIDQIAIARAQHIA